MFYSFKDVLDVKAHGKNFKNKQKTTLWIYTKSSNYPKSNVGMYMKQILDHIFMSLKNLFLVLERVITEGRHSLVLRFRFHNRENAQGWRTKVHSPNYSSIANFDPMTQEQDGIPQCSSPLKIKIPTLKLTNAIQYEQWPGITYDWFNTFMVFLHKFIQQGHTGSSIMENNLANYVKMWPF